MSCVSGYQSFKQECNGTLLAHDLDNEHLSLIHDSLVVLMAFSNTSEGKLELLG